MIIQERDPRVAEDGAGEVDANPGVESLVAIPRRFGGERGDDRCREDGGDDVYLSAREMRSVFDGDRVAIKIIGKDRRGKPEGDLVEVLKRGVREIAGQFIRERGKGRLVLDIAVGDLPQASLHARR